MNELGWKGADTLAALKLISTIKLYNGLNLKL